MNDSPIEPQPAIDLPPLGQRQFRRLIQSVLSNPNLGAGIDVSGTSGSGKSNFSKWAIRECARLGIPFIHIDPHGDAAKDVWRMCLELPSRVRKRIIYWRVADPRNTASINPLSHDPDEDQLTEFERQSRGRIQVALTASVILAAVGESGAGFAFRPVMRKWITRWLWLLWQSNLTLPDARMLIDPHDPTYDLLVQLAPDATARYQLEALPGMKVSDLEAEIGSARNRVATLLEHPATDVLLARRQNNIDFRELYRSGTSLIVDLDRVDPERGEILSDEVQRMVANVILTSYLAVVCSTPEHQRQRRFCVIDELPVFIESCGPLLERMCTEIRKYRTSFMFLHQGGARFPGRTDNEFLRTIIDMCRVRLLFRHNVDAEFFGRLVALKAHQGPRIKHVQTTPQQFTEGHEIVELVDRGEGTSEMEGQTLTDGTTDNLTDTLTTAVRNAEQQTRANASGTSHSHAQASQRTSTRTTNVTVKQTLVPKIVTRDIVSSIQFYAKEELEWAAASKLGNLQTGEAIVSVDGQGIWITQTPEAKQPLRHAPKFAAKKLAEWRAKLLARPEFATPEQIMEERRLFLDALVQELRLLSNRSASGRLDGSSSIVRPAVPELLIATEPLEDDPEVTL